MADVGKVQGPSGAPEQPGKKEKAEADADKFKQAMRRRVSEVSKTDADEQKKRKRREEAEEEEELQGPQQGPTTPASQVTPFSLEQEKKKVSPLEMQKGGPGISPTESAQPTPTTAFFKAPSPAEMEDDSGILEEESFEESQPPPSAGAPTPGFGQQPPPVQPGPPEEQAPAYQPPAAPQTQPIAPGPPESAPPPERRAARAQPGLSSEKTGVTAEHLEGKPPTKVRDTSAFFEQMDKEREKRKKTSEELAEEEAQVQGAPGAAAPPPFAETMEGGKEKKAKEKEGAEAFEAAGAGAGTPELAGGQAAPAALPEITAPYANLHPEIMNLFDRMVGVMTVMTMSGISETTFILNAPQFASSVFFGTQIIIQEFSTAPKAFNIQINGNPQAVALFQGNADDLMAAFQAGNYNFRINRLETGYLSERPLFKRKEKAGGKDKEQTGENPR